MRRRVLACGIALLIASGPGCGDEDDASQDLTFAADVLAAVAAVEAELGTGQEYFEVTATPQLTNVFVASDDGTAAVPYVFLDGELQPPAPTLTGVSGHTFGADDIDIDPEAVLDQIADEVPDATIESFSVEGGAAGDVRYLASVRSAEGGLLDVTVGPDGEVLAVDPV